MAIAGLKKAPEVMTTSGIDQAVETTVMMLERLGLVEDEEALFDSLITDFTRLAELGEGRLYVRLSSSVPTAQLIQLANTLAAERSYDSVYLWSNFWTPGTEAGSITEQEFNGSSVDFQARLALYSDNEYDRLLHFGGLAFDRQSPGCRRGHPTQLDLLEEATANFAAQHPGASCEAADHRDFLAWYNTDLISGVPASQMALARGFMRVPATGRRSVVGDSYVGHVDSFCGRAGLGGSYGRGYDNSGVGLSAGFKE